MKYTGKVHELAGLWVVGENACAHFLREDGVAACGYKLWEPAISTEDAMRCQKCIVAVERYGLNRKDNWEFEFRPKKPRIKPRWVSYPLPVISRALDLLFPDWRKDKEVVQSVLDNRVEIEYEWWCPCGRVLRDTTANLKQLTPLCASCLEYTTDKWLRGKPVAWRIK